MGVERLTHLTTMDATEYLASSADEYILINCEIMTSIKACVLTLTFNRNILYVFTYLT